MLRCKELGLNIAELEHLHYGTVVDMLTERNNDEYDYPIKATQKDFDKFGSQ